MLFGASLVYACFGAQMAAMTVLVNPISDSLSLSPIQMGTILGAWQFVYLFTAIPTGAVVDRYGLRPCLLIAGLILAASAAMRAVADSYFDLLFAVFVFGIGGPLISIGAPKLVSGWFAGAERGLAMGIYSSSTGIGVLLGIVLTNSLIMPVMGGDWRGVFVFYTVITLISVASWLAIVSHPASRLGDSAAASVRLDFGVFLRLLRAAEIRVILWMAIAAFFFIHAMSAWLPEILRVKGLSLVEASSWAGLPAIVAIFGALVIPRLAIPHRRLKILMIVSMIGIASVLLLEISPLVLLVLSLVGLGVTRSALVPVGLLILMESRALGAEKMGAATGLFFTAGQIGGVLGPLLCGVAITATGSYEAPLWLMAGVLAVLFPLTRKLG